MNMDEKNSSDALYSRKIKKLNMEINALKIQNINLNKIIALIPGNVYWKDLKGYYLGCNNNFAKILGYDNPEQIIGKKDNELYNAALAQPVMHFDDEVYTSVQSLVTEERAFDLNKQEAIYLTQKSPSFDDQGNITGLIGISIDITERKRMEEDLKIAKERADKISRAKSEFISNLSHDIKTPLAGMIGMAELLTYHLKEQKNLEFAHH
jgi:two-component system aerobic respiration control sensor histidine kinase ArcB